MGAMTIQAPTGILGGRLTAALPELVLTNFIFPEPSTAQMHISKWNSSPRSLHFFVSLCELKYF